MMKTPEKNTLFFVHKKVTNSALHCSILPDTLRMEQGNLFFIRMNENVSLEVRLNIPIQKFKEKQKNE